MAGLGLVAKDVLEASVTPRVENFQQSAGTQEVVATSVNATLTSLTERRPIRVPQSLWQTEVDLCGRAELESIETVTQ